jgi:hypothetical protein
MVTKSLGWAESSDFTRGLELGMPGSRMALSEMTSPPSTMSSAAAAKRADVRKSVAAPMTTHAAMASAGAVTDQTVRQSPDLMD